MSLRKNCLAETASYNHQYHYQAIIDLRAEFSPPLVGTETIFLASINQAEHAPQPTYAVVDVGPLYQDLVGLYLMVMVMVME